MPKLRAFVASLLCTGKRLSNFGVPFANHLENPRIDESFGEDNDLWDILGTLYHPKA